MAKTFNGSNLLTGNKRPSRSNWLKWKYVEATENSLDYRSMAFARNFSPNMCVFFSYI